MAEKVLNVLPGILGSFAFFAILIIWVVELILSARWDKMYFTTGMPVFTFRVPVKNHHANIPSCQIMENNFRSSGLIRNSSLLFRELNSNTIGFRESLLQLGRWYSVMHGVLVFDNENSQVEVKGFFDWTFLCFLLTWIFILPLVWLMVYIPGEGEPLGLISLGYFGIIFIITMVFCSIDYFRFSRVAAFAAQAWTRQHHDSSRM